MPFTAIGFEVGIVGALSVCSIFALLWGRPPALLIAGITSAGFLGLVSSDLGFKYLYGYLGTSAFAWYAFYLPVAFAGAIMATLQMAYVFKAAVTNKGETQKMKLPFQKKPSSVEARTLVANVYLRNTGKGKVEALDGSIRFYIEKGLISKANGNMKEIPLAETSDLTLDGKEISLTWKEKTEHLVFQDNSAAKAFLETIENSPLKKNEIQEEHVEAMHEAKSPIQQPEETLQTEQTPVQESNTQQKTPEKNELNVVTAAFPTIDSLFDILINLNGKINWDTVSNSIQKLQSTTLQLNNQGTTQTKIETSRLAESFKKGNIEATLKETYEILLSIDKNFDEKTTETSGDTTIKSDPQVTKKIIKIYYLLNDIILGSIVNDQTLQDEINQFKTKIDAIVQDANIKIDITETLNAITKLTPNSVTHQIILECRSSFQNQLIPKFAS